MYREKERAGHREAREEQRSVSFVGTLISECRAFWPMLRSLQGQRHVPGFPLKAQSTPSSLFVGLGSAGLEQSRSSVSCS